MTGALYVIGVGPGDPELLTLKAARILREVPCICVPKGKEEGSSLALSIVEKAVNLDGKEIIEAYFPMRKTKIQDTDPELDTRWSDTVENLLSRLNRGINIAFLTIGDPTIYSTFFYLYDSLLKLNPELDIEIIPGVSSINASASRARLSLGLADERIAILPANYTDDLKKVIREFDTVILMKVNKVFDSILKTLAELDMLDNSTYVSRVGMKDEEVCKNIKDIKKDDLNYFSMIIIKK